MITYESQVTLQSQMASTRLTTISMAGMVLVAAEYVPQVVQVGDKPSLQEEFMNFCMLPLPPKVTALQRWISIGMQSAKSKTACKLNITTPHWQNSQKLF